MDGDGDRDVVVHGDAQVPVPVILLNDGQGGLVPSGGRLFAGTPSMLFGGFGAGDVDDDGDVDVLQSHVLVGGVAPLDRDHLRIHRRDPTLTPSQPLLQQLPPLDIVAGQTSLLTATARLSDQTPCVGQSVAIDLSLLGAATTFGPSHALTRANGIATINVTAGAPSGPAPVSFTLPDSSAVTQVVTTVAPIQIYQGNGQSTVVGSALPLQLGIIVPPVNGSPVPSAVVWSTNAPAGLTFSTTSTNYLGQSFTNINPTNLVGTYTATATIDTSSGPLPYHSVTFTFSVMPYVGVAIASGNSQFVDSGAAYPLPLTVHVTDPFGIDVPGVPITFTPSVPGPTLSASVAVTGSDGRASVTATAVGEGNAFVLASHPTLGSATFTSFTRRFAVVVNSNQLLVSYRHEHWGVSITIMVDAPLPSPGFVATPFGPLYCSVLNPAPTLSVLDGIGWYGPITYNLVTNVYGLWTGSFSAPTPPGLNWVAQVVSHDPSYPYPAVYDLSNPAFFTF